MMKTLITGPSGFIGSYLTRAFHESGREIVGLDLARPGPAQRFIQGPAADAMTLEQGDLSSWSTVTEILLRHRPETIVHNASFVRPDIMAREPLKALTASLEPSLMVFEAARLTGVRRVVYFSTIGVFPRRVTPVIGPDHPVIMASEGTPDTFYGAAKIAAEAFAFAYYEAFGMDMVIIRPSATYGFGMNWPIYVKPMVEDSLEGRPVRFDTGADMPRDYVHAADVAQLALRAATAPTGGLRTRVFHAGTGRDPVTAGALAAVVRETIPGADIEIGPGLAPDEERDAATRGRFDIAAAQSELGYAPRFADIRDGIADYVATFRAFRAAQA